MPKKWIVLLDVDDTCAMSNSLYGQHNGGYRYHEPLFQALKKANLVQVYLFTSYSLRAIAKNLVEEPITTPSRLKLIQHLSGLGFQVEGVITPFDLVFNQGIGTYYEQRIKPYERQVLEGVDLQSKPAVESYVLACEQEEELRKNTHKIPLDKGSLYACLIQQLEKTLLQNNFAFIVVDDRSFHLEVVQKQNALHRYPLCSLLAKPHATLEEYLPPLQRFIHSLTIEALKTRFEQRASLSQEMQKEYEALHKRFHSEFRSCVAMLDAILLEEIECFCIKRDALQDRSRLTISSHPKSLAWPEPDASAERLRKEIMAIIEVFAASSSEPQVELYGLASTPTPIPLRLARQLLSQDENGKVVKKNRTGSNIVTHLGQVFFKSGAGLSPFVEQAVYQMGRQLGGELVAPTQLLLLDMPRGKIPFQASLAIEGVSLEEIIRIPGLLNGFKRVLGVEALLKLFPRFLELMDQYGKSYSDWLCRQQYERDMPWEQQLKILLDTLYALPVDRQPDGLTSSQKTELEQRNIVEEIIRQDFRREPLLPVLALIGACPKLTEEVHIGDLLMLPNCFRLLRHLYPGMPPETCLEAALNILSNFDLENLHRHLLLALLTEPSDHKGDNFIVPLNFDSDGNLLPFKIIAIDNDRALKGCFFRGKSKEHSLEVKTVIYRLISGISAPFSPALINALCTEPAEILLLEWLGKLLHYSKPYSQLKEEGVLSSELYNDTLHLQEPFPLGTIERLRDRLQHIQTLLSTSPSLTSETLLLGVEPLVGRYYQRFGERHPDLQTFVLELFKKRSAPSLQSLLSEDTQIIAEHFSMLPPPSTLSPVFNREDIYQTSIDALIHDVAATKRNARFLYLCSVFTRLNYTHIVVTPLTLTEQTVADVYAQEPEGLILFLKACETVTLQIGGISLPLDINNSQILFHVLCSSSDSKILILNMLLTYGLPVNTPRPIDGFTPLHFAASFYPEGVLPLLQAGAHTEILDTQGLTPLDLALLYHQTKTVETLLSFGAGGRLRVANGFKLISRYQGLYPGLCQALISRHRELAWQLALEHVSQAAETAERVCLIGPRSHRYLKSDVYRQIFAGDSAFPKTNLYGRHNVTNIDCTFGTVSMGIHLKENPELPGREIMVQTLASQLFGFITPHVALWRFSKTTGFWRKTEIGYPVLASHTITGKLLTEVLESQPEWLAKLDTESVHEAIILAMLINPEDGRDDNYMVQPFSKGTETAYRLLCIDNDHAFVRPVLLQPDGQEVAGPRGLNVKTILYCLETMKAPLVKELRERLLALDTHHVLVAWLQSLQKKQEEIDKLFNETEKRELKLQNIHLDIAFQPSIVVDIYQKLVRIQAALRRTPDISLLGLLRRVIPSLGVRYESAFNTCHSASERFMFLTKGQFKTVMVAGKPRLGSKTPIRDIISQTPQLKLEELKTTREQAVLPHQAFDCLKRVAEELTQLRKIRDEVQVGEFRQFRALMNSDNQERVVNGQGKELPGLDFAAMKLSNGQANIALQVCILEELQCISFRRLKIHDCEALTDGRLNSLLMRSSGLLALDIENCAHLTQEAMQHVAIRCPSLEKLGVNRLPRLQTIIELPFLKLRILTVGGCLNLDEWRISAPQLVRIEINQCERLARLSTQSLLLKHLKLRRCPKLSNEQLNEIMRLPEHLQLVQLSECSSIHYVKFYQNYPQLVQLPVYRLSMKVVAELNQQLNKVLSELGFGITLSANMIDSLQQGVSRLIKSQQQLMAAFLQCLNDSHPDVKARAAVALGQLWDHLSIMSQVEVVCGLLKGLNDNYYRVHAAEVLGKLETHFSPTTQAELESSLLKGLYDSYLGDSARATVAFSQLWAHLNPGIQAEVVSRLLQNLNDSHPSVNSHPSVRSRVAEALGKLVAYLNPSTQAEVVSRLLKGLNDSAFDVRAQAVEELGKFGAHLNSSAQSEVVSEALQGLSNSDSDVRAATEGSIVHLLSPQIVVDNLMYAFKAAYQKEFYPQNSKRRAKELRDEEVYQERKEKQEASTHIERVPENMCEVDVPADGTCLFYSVMFAFLLPVINDNAKFRARYLKLFGDEVSNSAEENRKRLQEYDGDPEFISRHTAAFEVLVNTTFRQKVVKYMRDNPKDFKVFIETEMESFETYIQKMEDPGRRSWGGQPEIVAISRLLEVNIHIYQNQERNAVSVPGNHHVIRYPSNCQISLVHTSVHKGFGPNNHYHYLIEKEYLKKRSVSNFSSSSSSQSTLPLFSYAKSITKTASLGSLSSGGGADEEKGIAKTKTIVEEQIGAVKQSALAKEVRLGRAERQAYELALAESRNDAITKEGEEPYNNTKEDIDNNISDIHPEEDGEGDDMERSPGLGLGIGK